MKNESSAMRPLCLLTSAIAILGIHCSKSLPPGSKSETPPNAVSIDLASPRQTIRGFGAANILPYRPDMTADEVRKAFGTDSGQIGLTILRLRIPPEKEQFPLNVPTARLAHGMGAAIIASPWTPPRQMKTNHDTVGGRLSDTSYASYAAHLKSFSDFMADNGAPLYAVSIQNEPDITVKYASCDWTTPEMLEFMRNYAPAVGTRMIAPESFNFDRSISDALLNDSVAATHLAVVGGHLYGEGVKGFFFSVYMSLRGRGHIVGRGLAPYPLALSKGKEVWMTEYLDKDTSWSSVLGTGKQIHDCMCAEMNSYIWWYIVRFYGPILETGEVSKRGYVMSQYARFVRPGFARVEATEHPQPDVYTTAYRNGRELIIVALNTGGSAVDQTFLLENGSLASVVPYTTSASKNCVGGERLPASRGGFSATLEPSSITTFVAN